MFLCLFLAKYGKCPAYKPPTPADCPKEVKHQCDLDGDCNDPDQTCCEGGCGERTCTKRVKSMYSVTNSC